jgi:hypothetical protein
MQVRLMSSEDTEQKERFRCNLSNTNLTTSMLLSSVLYVPAGEADEQ